MKINTKNKKIILVDYFDTAVFRCVLPSAVQLRWAEVLKQKFAELGNVSAEDIVQKRSEAKFAHRNDFNEVPYSTIVEDLRVAFNINCPKDEFLSLCLEIEETLELAVQVKNQKLIGWLKEQKQKGKKVFVVSDSHLPLSSYQKFVKSLGIADVFDGIFASAEANATKRRDGSKLYHHVLDELGINKKDAIMIGDNHDSDVQMASLAGIDAVHYRAKYSGIIAYPSKKFCEKLIKHKLKKWKNTLFFEYAYMFFIFVSRLYEDCVTKNVKKLTFLSRDGYFLKQLFDSYQKMFVKDDCRIQTLYCYNSRRVNQSAQTDQNARQHFAAYMADFVDGEYINIVDCGWNNSSQESIQNILGIKTRGWYIGTFSKKDLGCDCQRQGVIYDIDEGGKVSNYYWLLRTNFTLVEQICAAPEGSVLEIKNNKPVQNWPEQEKYVYERWTKDLQSGIQGEFLQLCAWLSKNNSAINYQLLAKINVRSGLFASQERLDFLNDISANYYDNFSSGKNTSGNASFRKAKPKLFDRLFNPEKRLSVLVKRQREIKSRGKMTRYKVWARLFYARLHILGKFNKK